MIRTSPHPLIPARWANPELVGFLLHPVPRSGTWRRLMFLQVEAFKAPGLPAAAGLPPPSCLARRRARSQILTTFSWRTCRFGGSSSANRQLQILLDLKRFLKAEAWTTEHVSLIISASYPGKDHRMGLEAPHVLHVVKVREKTSATTRKVYNLCMIKQHPADALHQILMGMMM